MTSPMTPARTFTTAIRGGTAVVHDPLTGQTHRAERPVPPGRTRLHGAEVASWPVVHPGDIEDAMPVSVCWSPLVRCNLACPHCLDDKAVRVLQGPDRRRIAHVLGESPILGVDISGGEPLLLRDLGILIDTLTAGGCAVSVTTNGTHLARRVEGLSNRVDAVRVSLDGPDAARHDRWRGRGSFDRATAGIRAAVAHGIPTQIQTVLLRSTARMSVEPMVDLAASLGVRGVTFLQMLPIGEGAALADAEQLSDDEARDLLADLDASTVAVRLRTREAAGGFTVIRADGQVWRNQPDAAEIATLRPLHTVNDLALTGRDGSA
ncbi:MAG: radical superfamily enzyme [Amycolatopsis sp.]|uniref:radical SAM protein n=1 Tax=Amycolatopsis sp. TaxID=37632 RepID=UPI002606D4FC|nr:radical SAM protein [Amycolatopsis sp.]MCU1680243.1 radical superfamily enzyme [Amycolatopsis sp.]